MLESKGTPSRSRGSASRFKKKSYWIKSIFFLSMLLRVWTLDPSDLFIQCLSPSISQHRILHSFIINLKDQFFFKSATFVVSFILVGVVVVAVPLWSRSSGFDSRLGDPSLMSQTTVGSSLSYSRNWGYTLNIRKHNTTLVRTLDYHWQVV